MGGSLSLMGSHVSGGGKAISHNRQKAKWNAPVNTGMKAKRAAKRVNFVSPNEKAKSAVVAQLVLIARKARLGGGKDSNTPLVWPMMRPTMLSAEQLIPYRTEPLEDRFGR
jgi:hypothetical protein